MGMIALAALCTDDEPTLQIVSERSAHGAKVLVQGEMIARGHAYQLAFLLLLFLHAGFSLRPLQE
jgi:hypothetical protein